MVSFTYLVDIVCFTTHCLDYNSNNCFSFPSAPLCIEGQVRLLVTRVQICQGKVWGYVCGDNDWSLENTRVVCRELGFSTQSCFMCTCIVAKIHVCIILQTPGALTKNTMISKTISLTFITNQIAMALKSTLLTALRVRKTVLVPLQQLSNVQVF